MPKLDFIFALLFLLLAALGLGELFRYFHQAPLIGEVIAGLILGPSVLGLIDPNPATTTGMMIGVVATLGIFFLVLTAGMEVGREGLLQAVRERTAIVAVVEFVFPFYFGLLLADYLELQLLPSLFLATGMAVTALPVSVRILMDLNLVTTRLGRAIVSVAVVNDVTAFAILGVLVALNRSQSGDSLLSSVAFGLLKILLFILLVFVVGWLLRRKGPDGRTRFAAFSEHLHPPEATFSLVVIMALGMGGLAEILGIHFAIGAFYAGIFLSSEVIGSSRFALVKNTTQNVGLGFLAPVFFAYVGLRVFVNQLDWPLVVIVIVVAFAGKVVGGLAGGRAAGFRGKELLALGAGLNARGMMELLLADIGLQAGILSQSLYGAIVLMTLTTTLCAPLLMRALVKSPVKSERVAVPK